MKVRAVEGKSDLSSHAMLKLACFYTTLKYPQIFNTYVSPLRVPLNIPINGILYFLFSGRIIGLLYKFRKKITKNTMKKLK